MKSNKMKYLVAAFAMVSLILSFGYPATADDYKSPSAFNPKDWPTSHVDQYPQDFADPYKYNPEKSNKTPEGIEWAPMKPRSGELQDTYTKLDFSMDKVFGQIKAAGNGGKCLSCHEGIEEISSAHAKMSCTDCHEGNDNSGDIKGAHKGMTSNPSDLSVAQKNCGECHKDHVNHVSGSLMATAAGEINSTRFTWGAQKSPEAKYGTTSVNGLKTIPDYGESGELVDDFLRKKCLRCHINAPAPKRQGDYRATGCAACHMIYSNDGRTKTGDKAIKEADADRPAKKDLSGIGPNAKRGYPLVHKFTAAVPTVQCVRCHSGNREGTNYTGMAEHDYEKMYRSPRVKGGIPPTLFGIEQHFIKQDIHGERGMACIDCHNQSEVEGDGKSYDRGSQAVKVRCQDCHGTPNSMPKTKKVAAGDNAIKVAASNPNYTVRAGDNVVVTSGGTLLANVQKKGMELVLTSKVTGKKHTVPVLAQSKEQPVNHQVGAHIEKMECHACHARYVPQDFALHVMREDYDGYGKWKRWREPDPNTMLKLFSNLGSQVGDKVKWEKDIWGDKPKSPTAATSIDYLTGEESLGVWYSAWTYRNWEDIILGKNSRGKASIFKPQYQYFVSHIGTGYGKATKNLKALKARIDAADFPEEKQKLQAELKTLQAELDKEVLKDSELLTAGNGKSGLIMNPAAPHTTRTVVRRCEKCHQRAATAGLGDAMYRKARDEYIPLIESVRMGLPIGFQLAQLVTADGDVLQFSTHEGARPFNVDEVKGLLGKSDAYRAFRYMDLVQQNYLSLKDRKNLTGGANREIIPGTSNGDVREVGSYYDWKRYGFWQTDPAVFDDDYFTGKRKKSDFSNDPDILNEKKEIEKRSLTSTDGSGVNLDWRPK